MVGNRECNTERGFKNQTGAPILPLSNQITRIEPSAASADCHGTSPLRRSGFIQTLAFLGDGHRGFELNNEEFMLHQLKPLIIDYTIKVIIRLSIGRSTKIPESSLTLFVR